MDSVEKKDKHLFRCITRKEKLDSSKFDVLVVSDAFSDEFVGGAELTLDALLERCGDLRLKKIHSSDLTLENVEEAKDKLWIFGNYALVGAPVLEAVALNVKNYTVLEFDYKFCKHRSLEKHLEIEGLACDCHASQLGHFVAKFLLGASTLWWMSEKQRDIHSKRFEELLDIPGGVLSSVLSDASLETIKNLRSARKPNDNWLILEHDSWIKGTSKTVKLAAEKRLNYELVGRVSPEEMLSKLASSKGLFFHPNGADTCPRIVIEAKLLGLELDCNEHVQHLDEKWFSSSIQDIEAYIEEAKQRFWNRVRKELTKNYTLSGYTTTLNCSVQGYPFEESIESMLMFCDEVVVLDGGSSDDTLKRLDALKEKHPHLKVVVKKKDWTAADSALHDGIQKAEARSLCSGDYLWQFDVDELVSHTDLEKIDALKRDFPKFVSVVSLPVVEAWGSWDKVRLDINVQKWRMSRNSPRITHGAPKECVKFTNESCMYLVGSDGCDMISSITRNPVMHVGFVTSESESLKQAALSGSKEALEEYQVWFSEVVRNLPTVYHASWLNIERKIRAYSSNPEHGPKAYVSGWTNFWQKLHSGSSRDTAETNMFFDKPWSEVTDEDIVALAKTMAEVTGGHIFHSKFDATNNLKPWLTIAVPSDVTYATVNMC